MTVFWMSDICAAAAVLAGTVGYRYGVARTVRRVPEMLADLQPDQLRTLAQETARHRGGD